VIVTKNGLHLSLRDTGAEGSRGDRAAFFQVFFAGEYDFLLSRISPGDVVLDAGANIGCFTIQASQLVGPRGVVIAVEPEAANADCLKANVRLNHLQNVTVLERALDAVSDKTVHIVGTGAMASLAQAGIGVRTITLDDVLTRLATEKFDLIKMDIEGSERLVFQTALTSAALGRARAIAVEVHGSESLRLVQGRLLEEGYSSVSKVKPESDFLLNIVRQSVRRPDLALRLYGTEIVGVVARMISGARRDRAGSRTPLVGLVYASR